MPQSAFIVRVPGAEPHVAHWREQFDPSARLGVPAHITLLFPFISPEFIDGLVREQISDFAKSLRPFKFRLGRIGRFPQALYLAPEPAAPFVAITTGLVDLFPEFRPYGGQHAGVVPHLTVAQAGEPVLLEVEAGLATSLDSGSIEATCTELVLIENSRGPWRSMHTFAIGASTRKDG